MKEYKAYCMGCKEKRKVLNAKIEKTENDKRAVRGKCPVCGTTLYKFLPSKKKEENAKKKPKKKNIWS